MKFYTFLSLGIIVNLYACNVPIIHEKNSYKHFRQALLNAGFHGEDRFIDPQIKGVSKALLRGIDIKWRGFGSVYLQNLDHLIDNCHHIPEEWAIQMIRDFKREAGRLVENQIWQDKPSKVSENDIKEALEKIEKNGASSVSLNYFKQMLINEKTLIQEDNRKEAERTAQEKVLQEANKNKRIEALEVLLAQAENSPEDAIYFSRFRSKLLVRGEQYKEWSTLNERLKGLSILFGSDLEEDFFGVVIKNGGSFARNFHHLPEKWALELLCRLKKRDDRFVYDSNHSLPLHSSSIDDMLEAIEPAKETVSGKLLYNELLIQRGLINDEIKKEHVKIQQEHNRRMQNATNLTNLLKEIAFTQQKNS
jgi:D-ribose pyranose/furanose isomerase RbsD